MARIFTVTVVLAALSPFAALAQDGSASSGCRKQGANICLPGGSARLSAARGDVLLSRGAGLAQIRAGEVLVPGDRLLVKKGGANLALGPACRTSLGPNSMVTITEKDGVTCASQVSADPKTVGADLPGRYPPPMAPAPVVAAEPAFPWVGALITGAAAAGVACLALCDNDKDRVVLPPPVVPLSF